MQSQDCIMFLKLFFNSPSCDILILQISVYVGHGYLCLIHRVSYLPFLQEQIVNPLEAIS